MRDEIENREDSEYSSENLVSERFEDVISRINFENLDDSDDDESAGQVRVLN